MKILLTNDDGILAKGLLAVHKTFARKHRVYVIAPDREKSAVGHGITLNMPIRAKKVMLNNDDWGYAVSGTPADCIKLGILELLPQKPDLVISGINPGANTGVNINYSGTVAAAREACLYGIPSIAVSTQGHEPMYFSDIAMMMLRLIEEVAFTRLPNGTFFNINVPDLPISQIAGIRISHQDVTFCREYIDKKTDPRNQTYYWHGAESKNGDGPPNADTTILNKKYVSITPIKCDMTDYDLIRELQMLETLSLITE
ncbi:MAG: 5'/3'-nucleotidase SurE [Desulfobacteraceae bacterium]|nr:MAG: 5'/3'-nucleotidase SurE [Desulfobacteraceae bacterium]